MAGEKSCSVSVGRSGWVVPKLFDGCVKVRLGGAQVWVCSDVRVIVVVCGCSPGFDGCVV